MSAVIERHGFYGSSEVAALVFARSPRWFYHWRNAHGAAEGFPGPIAGQGRPRWRGADLLDWRRGAAPAASAALSGPTIVDIRARLRARSRALAGRALA